MRHSSMLSATKEVLPRAKKPPAVMLLVVVAVIGTGIAIVGGSSILWPGTFLDTFWKLNPTAYTMFTSVGQVSGLMLLCLGVLSLFTGLSLLKGSKWSWWLALFLLLVVGSVNISRFIAGDPGEFFGTPFILCLLWLHTRPNVRKYFGIQVHLK